jgi:hypothetical protein
MVEFLKIESKDKKSVEPEFQYLESLLISKIIEYHSLEIMIQMSDYNRRQVVKQFIQKYLKADVEVRSNDNYPIAFDIAYTTKNFETNEDVVCIVTAVINQNAVINNFPNK